MRAYPSSALPLSSPLQLRRIFGSDVVQAVDRQDVAEAAQRRRQAHAVRGMPSRRKPLKYGGGRGEGREREGADEGLYGVNVSTKLCQDVSYSLE